MLNVDTWMTGKNTKNNVNLEQKEIYNMNAKFLTRDDVGKTVHLYSTKRTVDIWMTVF